MSKKNKIFKSIIKMFLAGKLVAIGYWLLVAPSVFAADFKFELEYPGLGPLVVPADKFIEWFFQFALGSAGVLAFGVLVFGGIKYIASAGNSSSQQDAKQWIQGAILGLILLLGSVLILSTINPDLTKLGVPPDPNFTIGGKTVILEPSQYYECMEIDTPENCGCGTPVKSVLFTRDLSCVYVDPTGVGCGINQSCAYCTGSDSICVIHAPKALVIPVPVKNLYCCSGPIPNQSFF